MLAQERYEEYNDSEFDVILMKIRNGTIKSGRYSHLVKIDKNKVYSDKHKEFFTENKGDK